MRPRFWIPYVFLALVVLYVSHEVFEDKNQNISRTELSSGSHTPTVLRLGLISSEGHPLTKAAKRFAEIVKTETAGKLEVQVFPGGALGGEVELQDMVSVGILQMASIGNGIPVSYSDEFLLLQMPYLWDNSEEMIAFANSPIQYEMNEKYRVASGIRVLASNWDQGARHLLSKRPVRSIADFRNLKLRIPQSPVWIDLWKTIGANPVQIPFPEVYMALQQGVVDGMECPLYWINSSSLYEQALYVNLSGHIMYYNHIIINDRLFGRLSAELQGILTNAALSAGLYETSIDPEINLQADLRAKMIDDGVEFINIDRQMVSKVVAPLYDKWEKVFGKEFRRKVELFKILYLEGKQIVRNNPTRLSKILEPVLCILLATLVLIVLAQIVSRYAIQLPFRGMEELARLIFVWACFLGVALCSINGKDIKAEFLTSLVPMKISRWIALVTDMIIVAVSTVMVTSGSLFVISRWVYPDYSTALLYPRSLFWLPVPLCGAVILIHTLKKIIVQIQDIYNKAE